MGKIGLSLPTAGYRETTSMLMPSGATGDMRMAYGMQLGSGTYDLLPSVTYAQRMGKAKLGLQYNGVIRMQSGNGENYRLGDLHKLSGWLGHDVAPALTASLRLDATTVGKIRGKDAHITGMMPGADPNNYGGQTVDAHLGLDARLPGIKSLKGHRLGIEVGIPLVQNLRGLQMEKDWSVVAGWRAMF